VKHPVTLAVATDADMLHAHFDYLKTQDPEMEKRRCPADPSKKRRCPDDHYNEPLNWQCEVGECGLCAVQILAGAENFLPSPNAEEEKRTLKEMRRLTSDLSKYRLACFARINGPVTVKVVPRA
jgi:ferredoxin